MSRSITPAEYRSRSPGRSAVYAIGRLPTDTNDNPFAGTARCTLSSQGQPAGLEVFTRDRQNVVGAYDAETDRAIYIVGRAVHPSHQGEELLHWCLKAIATAPASLGQLLGYFVLLVDDRRQKRIEIVTDVLGARAWFTGQSKGRFVSGTDVLGICDANLSTGQVDYDSLGSWLCYNFVAGGGSIVSDYRRVRGGTISTFDVAGKQTRMAEYAQVRYRKRVIPPQELVEALHERVSRSFDVLLRGKDEINLPLSGGYDSRLLCAMAARRGGGRFHFTTVGSTAGEVDAARQVAGALGIPWRLVPRGGCLTDFYPDPLWFRPEGFPTARNLTNAVARLHPGVPLMNGFIGDVLMRGSTLPTTRAFLGLDDSDASDHEMAMAAHKRYLSGPNRMDLLRLNVKENATERGFARMLGAVREGRQTGRPIAYCSLMLRQSNYFGGIFLSHLDVSDALLPYYTWDLISFNMEHCGSFAFDTAEKLFMRYFPKLGHILHASQLQAPRAKMPAGPSRHLRSWAAQLLRGVTARRHTTGIAPRKVARRIPEAMLTGSRYEIDVTFLNKVLVFEERLRQANVHIDWAKV